jgi:hypothetical protein
MLFERTRKYAEYFLVADIGGTWARLAIAAAGRIVEKKVMPTREFSTDVLRDFLRKFEGEGKRDVLCAALACAGPVQKNTCRLTHSPLFLDAKKLTIILGIPVMLLNDLEADAYYAKKHGAGTLLVSPGTGLGVSIISRNGEVVPTEDGHMPADRFLLSIKRLYRRKKSIEYEDLLAAKDNLLADAMGLQDKTAGGTRRGIRLGRDDFSKIYIFILESFLLRLVAKHSREELRTLVLTGGVVRGNKNFFARWAGDVEKRMAINVEIIEDELAGVKGALAYIGEKTNLNVK